MPFGIDLPDIDLPDLNPFDDDKKKPKRPKKEPKKSSKKKKEGRDESFWGMVKHIATPGAMFKDVADPVLKATHAPRIIRSIPEDVAELGAGLLPAAKTVGGMGYRDLRRLARHHDPPSWHDMKQYYDLMKYEYKTRYEEAGKKKPPKTDSEIIGLLAELTGAWGRGIERALPDPTSHADMKEFRKAWTEDPVFTLLDVVPFAAAVTRPLSVAKYASRISKANDISRGKAIAAAARESYYPGSAARKGLEGGIAPREITAKIGGRDVTVGGRPWSRIPLMREFQRTTDNLYALSPKLSEKRVGRIEQRMDAENMRRVKLQQKELERPIGELLYGRVGRNLGAFGLKEGMNPRERRFATGLAYAMQMPKWMDPHDAIEAVKADLSSVYNSGHMEVPRGRGRVKRMKLSDEEKNNLAIQISDLDIVRQELRNGDITPTEWDAAMDAMGDIAGKTHEMGIDIMRRRYHLDDEETAALEAAWKQRAELIPRRLAARGQLAVGNLGESQARQARIAELTEQLGPEQAQFLTALTDARARAARPQDPASFWEDRVGVGSGESAAEYVGRVGDEALFPQMEDVTDWDKVMYEHLIDSGEFYSPIQKWIDEVMPNKMPAAQLQGTLKNAVPKEAWENANLDAFFHDLDPLEMVYKTDFQAHMANPLNAFDLKEILLSNAHGMDVDMGTVFDRAHDGNYMSRDPAPGEYFELLLQAPGPPRYKGKGWGHWERDNIAVHVRFHIFREDGKLKMLIEEIQSDWGNEYREHLKREKRLKDLSPEDREEIEYMRGRMAEAEETRREVRARQEELDRRIREGEDDQITGDLTMEWYSNQDRLDNLQEYIREMERALVDAGADATPIAPLGTGLGAKSSYINPTIRWLLRRADEQGVDEIIVVGRETQLARNAEHLDPRNYHALKDEGAEAITSWFKDNPYTRDRSFLSYDEDIPAAVAREMGEQGRKVDDAYDGTYRVPAVMGEDAWGRMPGTVFKMTDEAKARAKIPKSLYQRQPNWKGLPHGAAELLEGRSIIHMFETGNVSTWIHELGHVGLYDLSPADLRTIEMHLGGGFKLEDWTKMEHERFARAFEQYVRKGTAPNKELASVFGKLSEWMKTVWNQAKGKKEYVDIDPSVKEVFDRMFDKPATDEFGVHGYFPHRDIHAQARADYRGGVRPPAAGQTIGVPRLTGETIQRKPNELMLYQGGAMNPDPAGLVNVFLNRLRFQVTLDARDTMWARGHSMSEEIPKGKRVWLVRNPDAPPERISARAQGAARGETLDRPVDDLEELLRLDPEDFRKDIIAKAGENPKWAEDSENVRWIEADYVESRFGEVFAEKPRGKMWSAMSLMTSLQRTTGIYGRPISYIGGNVPFNVLALMSSMPVSTLRNAAKAFDIKRKHPKLWRAINSESGETRAGGGLPERYVRPQNDIQRYEQRATSFQRGMAEKLSGFADDPFRTIAFLNNARKRGYSSVDDLRRLIEEDGTDLHEVRQLTREQMLDFDALNPTQRKIASQFLYLWPFMYASIKWPAMFAREYPGRAMVAANQIEREPEKGLPQEVTNLWKRFGIDLTTINPIGPVGSVAEDTNKFFDDPTKLDLTALKERLSPTLDALVEGMGGGRKNALQNFIRGTVPGASEVFGLDPEFRGAKIYKDRSYWDYIGQRHVRYWPRGVNKERLGEMIEDALSDKVKGSTIEKEKAADWEKITKYATAVGDYNEEEVQEVRTSFKAWWEYQEAVDQKKDSLGQRKLTPFQQIEVLTPIIEEYYPDLAGDLWDMEPMRDEEYQRRNEKALNEYADAMKNAINEGRTMIFNNYRSYGPED